MYGRNATQAVRRLPTLDITMDDTLTMQVCQRNQNFTRNNDNLSLFDRSSLHLDSGTRVSLTK